MQYVRPYPHLQCNSQARRRVMESGPAEVSDECWRHERGGGGGGGEHERGISSGVRGSSPEKIFELSTPVRAF